MALVENIDKEIAWHGIVEKIDNTTYLIKDIIVYPQKVTGATVTTDDVELGMWYMQLPDETMNNLRFQGHSHVNMSTSPSAVDKNYYSTMVQTLRKTDFYIFMIFNKRGEHFAEIYDLAQNVLFENNDINISVVDNSGMSIKNWALEEIKNQVKTETISSVSTYTTPTRNTYQEDKFQPDLDWSIRTATGEVWSRKKHTYVVPEGFVYDPQVRYYISKENYIQKYGALPTNQAPNLARSEKKGKGSVTINGKKYTIEEINNMPDEQYFNLLERVDRQNRTRNNRGKGAKSNGSVKTS